MDKVQIYTCVVISLGLVVGLAMDGRPKEESTHKFATTFIGLMLSLPIYGRIFGIW